MHNLMKHRGRQLCNAQVRQGDSILQRHGSDVFQNLPWRRDQSRLRYARLYRVFMLLGKREYPVFGLTLQKHQFR